MIQLRSIIESKPFKIISTIFIAIFFYFVFYILHIILRWVLLNALALFYPPGVPIERQLRNVFWIITTLIVFIPYLIYSKKRYGKMPGYLRPEWKWIQLIIPVIVPLSYLTLRVFPNFINTALNPGLILIHDFYYLIIDTLEKVFPFPTFTPPSKMVGLLSAIIVAPITEEIIRAAVIDFSRSRTKSVVLAVLLSAFIFMIGHPSPYLALFWLTGILYGVLYLVFENVLLMMVFHGLGNFFAMVILPEMQKSNMIDISFLETTPAKVIICIFYTALLILMTRYLVIREKERAKEIPLAIKPE